jgi:nucleotide-binding universal stress UspA family protein
LFAKEHGFAVRLIHAYHWMTIATPAMVPMETADTVREYGADALREATERVHDTARGVEVDTELVRGSAPAVLINASKDAALVVVGRNPVHGLERMLSGSTSTPVAARAHSPVVSVPAGWDRHNDAVAVVVGSDGSAQGRAALAFAFDEASRRGGALTAIRIWTIPPSWAFDVVSLTDEQQWLEDAEISLAEDLAGLAEQYPDVHVTRIIERSASPARSLISRSASASLLVIGARGHGGIPGLDMGMVARGVLAHADVPVAVVHRGDAGREAAEAAQRSLTRTAGAKS